MQNIISFSHLTTEYPEIKACFFDMDGTLMLTEKLHAMAINQLIEEEKEPVFDLQTLEDICIGFNDEVVFKKLRTDNYFKSLNLTEFISRKTGIFSSLLKEIKPEDIFNEKVRDLLKECKKHKLKLILVTSSEKDTTLELIRFLQIEQYFDSVITREDTVENKPHPAPYHLAMKRVSLSPEKCLIFEDSQAGRTAAKKSGAHLFEVEWYNHQ